jgi:acetyl esterase/lipase
MAANQSAWSKAKVASRVASCGDVVSLLESETLRRMLRWLLLILAFALVALGSLNVMKAPAWSAWQLAVLAGEYGHWFAIGAWVVGVLAWWLRDDHVRVGAIAAAASGLAMVLLLKPAFQAWQVSGSLSGQFAAWPHARPVGRDAFSISGLFLGAPEAQVPVEALKVAADLPLDFYRATGTRTAQAAPCVVLVHGGGWDSGDRKQIPELNHWLARQGYAVAAVSYRFAPRFVWPAQREDLLTAITWLKAHAAELGIDPHGFVLMGRSAGGQIALVTGYTAADPAIRGVVALYAPSDLIFGYMNTHENDMLKSPALMRKFLAGTPESARANYQSASALFHVGPRTPPTLMLHGENDALVWHRHSIRLDARLAEAGVPHAFVSLPWATHAFDYNLHGPGGQLTRYAIEWFLAGVTK